MTLPDRIFANGCFHHNFVNRLGVLELIDLGSVKHGFEEDNTSETQTTKIDLSEKDSISTDTPNSASCCYDVPKVSGPKGEVFKHDVVENIYHAKKNLFSYSTNRQPGSVPEKVTCIKHLINGSIGNSHCLDKMSKGEENHFMTSQGNHPIRFQNDSIGDNKDNAALLNLCYNKIIYQKEQQQQRQLHQNTQSGRTNLIWEGGESYIAPQLYNNINLNKMSTSIMDDGKETTRTQNCYQLYDTSFHNEKGMVIQPANYPQKRTLLKPFNAIIEPSFISGKLSVIKSFNVVKTRKTRPTGCSLTEEITVTRAQQLEEYFKLRTQIVLHKRKLRNMVASRARGKDGRFVRL